MRYSLLPSNQQKFAREMAAAAFLKMPSNHAQQNKPSAPLRGYRAKDVRPMQSMAG